MIRIHRRPENRLDRISRPVALALGVAGILLAPALAGTAFAQKKLVDIAINPTSASVIPGATQAFTATGIYSDGTQADLTSQVSWRARDPKIASIDATGLARAIDSGRSDINAVLIVNSNRVSSRHPARLNVAELDEVAVVPTAANVRVGGAIVLRALGTYDNGVSGVDITSQVTWASKKRSVVIIETNAEGAAMAVGVAPGETNVEATEPLSGVRSDSTTGDITVVGRLITVEVTPEDRLARIGERVRFKATGTFERGLTTDISTDVQWTTGNPSIATVDLEGRVTGVSIGSTSVIATDRDSGITSTANAADGRIDVTGNMTALEVKPSPTALSLGGRANLKASARFDGITKSVNVTTKVEWSSSDPSKVSVTRLGVVNCLSVGSALISARDPFSGVTSTASGKDGLVRCGISVSGVAIAPATHTMRVTKTKKVKAFLVYSDDSRDDITKRVIWQSSNVAVATVDTQEPNIGRVNGIAPGTATVTAEDPVSGFSSAAPGGTSLTVTIIP